MLFFIHCTSMAQEQNFGDDLQVGSSVFYYEENNLQGIKDRYGELSISTSFNVNLNKRFYVGIRNYLVKVHNNLSPTFNS